MGGVGHEGADVGLHAGLVPGKEPEEFLVGIRPVGRAAGGAIGRQAAAFGRAGEGLGRGGAASSGRPSGEVCAERRDFSTDPPVLDSRKG
jgi:hypothetical protein